MVTLAKWSVKEYHQMIATGLLNERYVELIEGKINDFMAEYLREKLRGKAKIYESHPVTLSDSEPEPDIAVVKLPVSLYNNRHPSAEEIYLLIEISDSTLEKDLEQKRIAYGRAGILEYWVVDLKALQLIRFTEPSEDSYQIQQTYTQGNFSLVAFPLISVSVGELIK